MLLFIIIISIVHISKQEYIRSDELILNENLEIGSEIINLNKLISQHDTELLFKIVNDTLLVNYIHLEYLNSETTLVLLNKKLVLDDICDLNSQIVESRTVSTIIVTCSQIIKIIGVSSNDFIELPIQIRKINFLKKRQIGLEFKVEKLDLNLTSIENSFLIEYPKIFTSDGKINEDIRNLINFKLSTNSNLITTKLDSNLSDYLNLTIKFQDENALVNSYDFKINFSIHLDAFFALNSSDLYEIKSNSTQIINLRVSELKKLNLIPLDFEQAIYTIVLEDNFLSPDDLIIQPRLKKWSNQSDIIFTLFQHSDNLPFYVDSKTGAVRLKEVLHSELNYQFGIKATYKRLLENKKNYYYDYMIPAFTKIQINVRKLRSKSVKINTEIISSFITKYEILNKESTNQTFIYYINNPIKQGDKLVNFFVQNSTMTNSNWFVNNSNLFIIDKNSTFLSIKTNTNFQDGQNFRINLKYAEKSRILNEINLEFRNDFDPLLFELVEYNFEINKTDLIGQNLFRVRIKDRLRRRLDDNTNVSYRLIESSDSNKFDINFKTGWLWVKEPLENSFYDLEVLAVDSDLQKNARVKCKIVLKCLQNGTIKTLDYKLFDNSLNGTRVGPIRPICQKLEHTFDFDKGLNVKLCSKNDIDNCKLFKMSHDLNNLFKIENDFLILNRLISSQIIEDLIQKYYGDILEDLKEFYDHVKMSFKILLNDQNYTIQIDLQSSPKIVNFEPKVILIADESLNSTHNSNCLINYSIKSDASLTRFVRIGENMAHFEPEFKLNECTVKFYITNNGCLTLRYDLNKPCVQQENETNLILKSGIYSLNFKLCSYDENKVACSEFYNQTIQVPFDLKNNSKFIIKQELEVVRRLESSNGSNLLKRSSLSVYLVILTSIIVLVALLTILFMIILFSKTNKKQKSLVGRKDLDFKKLEINTDIGIQPSANTPESSSNSTTATNSTKISKNDDDDEAKIQVLDDYVDMSKQFKQMNFGYENNNFSYSGSFRSVGSSNNSEEIARHDRQDKIQGLYSVKNASIQFQNNPNLVSPRQNYDFYACVQDVPKPESIMSDLTTYNCLLVNTSVQMNDQYQQQLASKTSSLKKLKKDLALKKAIYSTVYDPNKIYSNLNTDNTTLSLDNSNNNNNNNKIMFDKNGSFSFINGTNDILFSSPNDVFASVV
ncbi:unnamed protein product [Brachionus calyciflorus]|uniref:Cadherin domain-containing protein n=1 Tax=Brachionus calyciflorus TaxID=104777 RepID=A0A813Q4A9_9BILA|nr:unnamed protein product [Brachionus calyciflorus]